MSSPLTLRKNFESIEERFEYVTKYIPLDQISRHTMSETFGITIESASNVISAFRKAGLLTHRIRISPVRQSSSQPIRVRQQAASEEHVVLKPEFGFPDKIQWTKTSFNEAYARKAASAAAVQTVSGLWKDH